MFKSRGIAMLAGTICLVGANGAAGAIPPESLEITHTPDSSGGEPLLYTVSDHYSSVNATEITLSQRSFTVHDSVGVRIMPSARGNCSYILRDGGVTCSLNHQDQTVVWVDTSDGDDTLNVAGTSNLQFFLWATLGSGDDSADISFDATGVFDVEGQDGNDTLSIAGMSATGGWLLGGDGDDRLTGSDEDDWISGGNDQDTVRGSGGDDLIYTGDATVGSIGSQVDGYTDQVFCSTGSDTVYAESIDNVAAGCEDITLG